LLTRTRQLDVGVCDTVHVYDPGDARTESTIIVHFEPPFVEYSIRTLSVSELVQVIVRLEPVVQLSPPFGAVTVTAGAAIVNVHVRRFAGIRLPNESVSEESTVTVTVSCAANGTG
jgi:hypothetical protein